MAKALRLQRHIRRMLMAGLLLSALAWGGCSETSPPPEATKRSSQVATGDPAADRQAASIRFTDVTAAAGLAFQHEAGASGKKWYPETMGSGGCFVDYNGNGWPDILLVNGRRWPGERQPPEPTLHLYRNNGDGTFADVTTAAGLDVPFYGMGCAAADANNDGQQDLLITGYEGQLFFRNNGDGTFTEATQAVGLAAAGQWSTAAAFFDYDRDGFLDLLIGHYVEWDPSHEEGLDCTYGTPEKDYCAVQHFAGQGLTLYRNLGDGRFRDVTVEAGMAAPGAGARVLGFSIVDHDQNGWPDVIVANDLTPSLFFTNNGDGTFREIGVPTGLVMDEGGVAFAGMGIDAAYINNDAQLCVAIGNFTGQPTTLHCQMQSGDTYHPEIFVEQSPSRGIARPTLRMVTFGLFFFDVDLNGWQDLFMVNGHVVNEERLRNVPYAQPPQLFRNRRDGTFEEIVPAPQSGLDIRIIGRGAAYADFDGDGDLDLLLTTNQGPAYLLRNDTPRSGHFLRVKAQGTRSNRDGIGAQFRLYTARRQLSAMVRTGSTYLSQSELPVTFGLEPDEPIERLEVLWPSGIRDVFRHLQPDTTFVAREGASQDEPVAALPPSISPAAEPYVATKRTAIAHYQAGRFEAASEAFEQVLRQQPGDYMVQQYLIELHWRRGRQAQAHALLAEMARTLPEANFFVQFGLHLEEARLHDLANEAYRTAAQLDPQAPEAPYRLGKHALEVGRYPEAVRHFREALSRQPHLVDAAQGIGLAYAAQGQIDQAEAQFQAVLGLAPDFAEAYTHLGKLYARSGRPDKAIQAYRAVIKLEPNRAQGYHNLGTVLADRGLVEEAMAQLEEAVRRDPHYLPARNDLGALYAEQGQIGRAIAEFSAAIQIDPSRTEGHYNLALAHAARGDVTAMIQALEETVRRDPDHLEARFNLGIGHLQQGELGVATEQLRTVVRLEPNHARAHSVLAALYFQRQQYELSWQHGQKAAQLGAPVESLLEKLRQLGAAGR